MNKYWKDPRLDDEGNYDYLIEELPHDSVKWTKFPCKCDCCGKEHKFTQVSTHYFYCYDGWDSMSYNKCWKCHLKRIIQSLFGHIKRKHKIRKENRLLRRKIYSNKNMSKQEKNEFYKMMSK